MSSSHLPCCDRHGHECAEPGHELCCKECPEWDNHCVHRAPTYDELHDPAEDYCVHCDSPNYGTR